MANKQLTAKVRLNTTEFESKIKRIAKAIDAINRAVGKQSNAYTAVNSALGKSNNLTEKVSKKTEQTTNKTKQWSQVLKKVNSKLNSSDGILGKIGSKLKSLAATYLGIMGLRTAITTSDTLTSAENKINYVTAQNLGGSGYNSDGTYSTKVFDSTEDALAKMYTSSQKVRMSYDDMMTNVSKSMVLCGDAFDNNTDAAIRFQEIMAEAYAVGGATAQEMSTSMYQLIQGMSGDLLAGDELRSVREGAPLAYKEIEKLAQKLYDTDETLKDIAADGKITADIVVAAILGAGDKMDKAFKQTQQTFAQTWTQIKNIAIRAFKPISDKLSEALNKAIDNGLIKKIEKFFTVIAKAIIIAYDLIERFVKWVAKNWGWIQHIIVAGLILMITWTLVKTGIALACSYFEIKALLELAGVQKTVMMSLISTISIIAVLFIAVMALIYVFLLWKSGAIDTCQAIVWAIIIIGVAATIVMSIITGGIVLIPALVAIAIALIITWLDYFLAIVYSIGAALWNIIVGLINAIIQFVWAKFIEPSLSMIEFWINAFNGGFDSFGDAVKNLIGNIISWFLSLGKVVTTIIDAIFGTNWTAGLESLKSKLTSWGKNENAITISREAPKVLNRISYTDAWNTGMNHGSIAKDWLTGLGSEFQGSEFGFGINNLADSIGVDTSALDNLFNSQDLAGVNGADDLLGDVGNISNNTDKIADTMKLSEEDLDYLRRIADMEWKKEFTTANITVEMTNNNSVDGKQDLKSLAISLREMVEEEMIAVANGVYA